MAQKKNARKPAAQKQEQTAAVGRFDGTWSVLVVTEAGSCDRAYRYSVQVAQGSVRYGGESGVTLTGGIDGSGHVNVSLSFGRAHAEGSGQLAGDTGSGTWNGHTETAQCSGRWEAERRAP